MTERERKFHYEADSIKNTFKNNLLGFLCLSANESANVTFQCLSAKNLWYGFLYFFIRKHERVVFHTFAFLLM